MEVLKCVGRLLPRLGLALLALLVSLEVGLRLLAPYLPPAIGNDTVHSYSTRPGGMFFLDGPSGMRFCYPHDSRRALANHYVWRHQTDARGLRNPPDSGSQVLLMGDSFIYGHGVEEAQSLAGHLRREHGWQVYNLARQGDGLSEQFVLFQLYFEQLKPKKVFFFAFVNDFGDIAGLRSPDQLAHPPELQDGFVESLRARLADTTQRTTTGHVFDRLYTVRFVATLMELSKRRGQLGGPYRAARWVESLTMTEKYEPLRKYYESLFSRLAETCRANGTELVVVDVDTASQHPEWSACQTVFTKFLRQLCRRERLRYLSLRPLFQGHPERQLEGDGHLNASGNKVLAEMLVRDTKF